MASIATKLSNGNIRKVTYEYKGTRADFDRFLSCAASEYIRKEKQQAVDKDFITIVQNPKRS